MYIRVEQQINIFQVIRAGFSLLEKEVTNKERGKADNAVVLDWDLRCKYKLSFEQTYRQIDKEVYMCINAYMYTHIHKSIYNELS